MTHYRTISVMALFLALTAPLATPLTTPLAAQPSLSVTLGSAFDAFRPVAGAAESQRNIVGSVSADNVFAAGRARAFYDLDAGTYDSPGDWSYRLHTAGASYRLGGSDSSGRSILLTGALASRRNGDAWTSADYTAAGAGLSVELHPRVGTTLRSGYRADFRRFGDLAALTQTEHRGFVSLLSSFQTRTSVIFEGQLGAKQYDGVVHTESVSAYPSSSERGTAGLASVMGRIAQSLTDRTGLTLEATARRTFGSVSPLLITTPAGFFEDGVYDDPFASNGLFVQAGVKHVFASAAELSAAAWWATKDYTSATALDASGVPASGSPLRSDRVSLGAVTWSQPLLAAKTGAIALSAELGYRFTRHRSTDAYYNYSSHALRAGISFAY